MIDKKIAIVGLGGLGGFVCEYIGRLNFKEISLIDKDVFSQSNINRQLLCSKNSIGQFKVDLYKDKLVSICESKINVFKEFINKDNLNILDDSDIIFDCLDNIESRLLLEEYSNTHNKVIIHGSIGDTFGTAALVLPNSNILSKLYLNKEIKKTETYGYAVSMIASIQVAIAMKYINNDYQDILNKILYVDLNDLIIKKLEI